MGPEDQRRAADAANRERLYWQARSQEEAREREARLADERYARQEAQKREKLERERLDRQRRLTAERMGRDAAQAKRVGEERTRRAETYKATLAEEARPKAPPRPVPLDAVGRLKQAAELKQAMARKGPRELPRGVRPSRLIQSLGPMGGGKRK